jgi:hypothetical protein
MAFLMLLRRIGRGDLMARRAFFRQVESIKAICRDLGVSRKVARKVIRSGVTEFRLRARRAAAAEDWSLARHARSVAIGERSEGSA